MRVTLAPPVNITFIRLGLLDNFVSGSSYYKELVIYLTLNEISSVCLEIHKLITSFWKKEKLPEERKESIIVPIHKKGDKIDCNNYRGVSLLPTTYKWEDEMKEKMEKTEYLDKIITANGKTYREINNRVQKTLYIYI